ncbi:MAG: hypothetical protein AB8G11_15910 [Saprospiraceae bacterium]
MKRTILFLIVIICMAFQPQNDKLTTQSIIKEVFELAKAGYDNMDAKSLIKAAKILIDNPEVRVIKTQEEIDEYEPSQDESILESHNFFNPSELLADAKKFAPYDAKILHWRIEQLEKRLKGYREMSLNYNKIKVKNYLVYGNNSKTILMNFDKNKKISMSVRIGNNLQLKVLDTTLKKAVGTSKFIGDARLLTFTAQSDGNYKITIENTSDKANDCYLMIETK